MKSVKILTIFSFLLIGHSAIFGKNITATFVNDSLSIEVFLSSKRIKAEKMIDGIFYTIHTEGVGVEPHQGDYVKIRYVGRLLSGKIFDKSAENEPYIFQLGSGQVIAGWNKAIPKLKIGTKTTLYIPSDLAYGTTGIGTIIPPNTPLIYDLEVVEVLNRAQYVAFMRQLEDPQRKKFENQRKQQFETDKKRINDYAILHRLKAQRTASGLSYVVTKEGKGAKPKEGSKVVLHYDGLLLSDQIFDATKDKLPKTIVMGDENLIEGLEEGLSFFNEGAEGYLLIPSKLALGAMPLEENGKVVVPPHSVLIYHIQIIEVK
jgi:FKBP-type peptidyl-prolyl cis-trans isomerase